MLVVWTSRAVGGSPLRKVQEMEKKRRVLKRELRGLGIGWQRRPEKKWLVNLLANEQVVGPLLKYLMTTEVGGREGEADGRMGPEIGPRRGGIT